MWYKAADHNFIFAPKSVLPGSFFNQTVAGNIQTLKFQLAELFCFTKPKTTRMETSVLGA
jgi:hypothetical protein